jgi:hypothetical protein
VPQRQKIVRLTDLIDERATRRASTITGRVRLLSSSCDGCVAAPQQIVIPIEIVITGLDPLIHPL